MQLDQLGPCGLGAARGGSKSLYDGTYLHLRERLRYLIAIGKCQRAGRKNRRPSALRWRDWLAAIPRLIGACLSAGVRQLNARHRTLFGNKGEDAPQWLNVRVTPDAEVLWTDAAVRGNGRRLCNHGGSASHGPAAQMDKVPVCGESVCARILAHG